MFYNYIEKQWLAGNVSVGLSADKSSDQIWIQAPGLTGFLSRFLSHTEKQLLANLAKKNAAGDKTASPNQQPPTELLCEFVTQYLSSNYSEVCAVYLYGSRAKGTHKTTSDHDFYLVYLDGTDCGLDFKHPDFLEHIDALRSAVKKQFGRQAKIDCMGCQQSVFEELKDDPKCHAGAAFHFGKLLANESK